MTDTTQTTDHAAAIRESLAALGIYVRHSAAMNHEVQKAREYTDALAQQLAAERETATRLRLALIEMATVYMHSDVTDPTVRRGTIRTVLATNRVADLRRRLDRKLPERAPHRIVRIDMELTEEGAER